MAANRIKPLILSLGALFLLSACAETQLIAHTAKRMSKPEPRSSVFGKYKVGNPYQIKGVWYYPKESFDHVETGIASWYGRKFHLKKTANGEVFDMNELTAAHRTLQMPSFVQVTNLENGRSLKLRVNDRGPFAHGRIIDVSRRAAQLLGFERKGTARVRVRVLGAESRAIAQRLTGSGTQVARANLPIRSDVQVAKPGVASQTLAPPPGAVSNAPVEAAPRRRVAVRQERVTVAPPQPDGLVTVESVADTDIYVQAGAFVRWDNANRVKHRLFQIRDVKITSYIIGGKEFFRVRSGPHRHVAEADRVLEIMIHLGYDNAQIIVD
ncbi:MAG: septal ring lytic transglycosylase RlpA family protein [Rhodospirillales bacterium]|nr:septal ring lytic transglycosylase RlpA family protein [Rhodospirillales bacterium]